MKKVLSLFLTVVMALSMFSCLSVLAGAAVTDLVVDQEYTVPHDTTKIFVPEESGYYKFQSNGNGDPCITIEWSEGRVEFDDDIGLDFSGIVYLAAGEEVSCYLYNYDELDCVFTITKVIGIELIEFTLAEPIEIIENTNGSLEEDWVWNDDTQSEDCFEYYRYDTPDIREYGNYVTVTYDDASTDIFTYDGEEGGFLNDSGDVLGISVYTEQSYGNQWTVGGENYVVVEADGFGVTTQIPVAIVENPYESIEFTPVEPLEIVEYTNGYWNSYWDDELGEEVEYYHYYAPDSFWDEGNTITVNYKDGSSDVYTYSYSEEYDYYNDAGEYLNWDYSTNQSYENQWSIGGENYITIECPDFGLETQVPVAIVENPYESIEFTPVEPLEIMEYTNGYWDDELGEEVEYYCYYNPDIWEEGNTITVNYKDGSSDVYTYSYSEEYDDYDYYNDAGEYLDWDYSTNQSYENQWSIGGENYITIECPDFGLETQVPVAIVENSYESIEFTPVEPLEVMEYTNGCWSSYWDDELGEEVEYYHYYTPDSFRNEGNTITVNYKDGSSDVYTYSYSEEYDDYDYYNDAGEYLGWAYSTNQSYENQWSIGGENYITVYCGDFGLETQVPVTITENESVVFDDTFVAEKVAEDKCVITDIKYDLNVLDIPETVNGCAVVGIEDGVLGNVYGLTEVNLPATFNMISDYTFEYCGELEAINVAEGNEVFASVNGILYNKALTEIIYCPDAFAGTFIIKAGVTDLSANAVVGIASAEAVEIEDGNTSFVMEDGVLYNADFTKIYRAFSSVDANFVMKETVEEIAGCAFSGNETIETVKFSAGVTEISYASFIGCAALTEVELPSNLVSIGEEAFEFCSALESIALPATTKNVGSFAFYDCTALTNLTINDGLESLGDRVFTYANINEINLPDSLETMGYGCFMGNENLSNATIGTGLSDLDSTFAGCISLESIEIPDNIISMDYAFSSCENLVSATVGSGVKSMEFAFAWCYNLETVKLAEGISSDLYSAFRFCEKLSDVNIPSTVTEIAYGSFFNCDSLTSITIPATVEVIEENAFGYKYDDDSWAIVKVDGFTIYGVTGSAAEEYAIENGFTFISIGEGHTHTASEWIVDSNGNCTVNGSKHKECTECGEVLETAVITAPGHTVVKDAAVAATCTTAGKTEGSHCSVCKVVIKAQTTVAAKGHTKSGWIVDKAATAAATGSKHIECTVCKTVLQTAVIPQTAPATPKATTANAVGGVKVSWNSVAGGVKYVVFRRAAGTKAWVNIGTTTGTSLIDANVASGKYYAYSVRAYNSAGLYSAYNAKLTSNRKYMASPKLTTIYNHVNGLAIKWNAVAGVTNGYRVYRRGAGSTYWTYLGTTKNLYWIDSGVKNANGGYYRYTVIADGGYHSAFDTTGLYLKRLANPALLSATSGNAGITVKWSAIKGTTGYYVYRKTAGSTWKIVGSVGGTYNTTYVDKTAQKGVTYTYTVRACYGRTLSSYNSGISCRR